MAAPALPDPLGCGRINHNNQQRSSPAQEETSVFSFPAAVMEGVLEHEKVGFPVSLPDPADGYNAPGRAGQGGIRGQLGVYNL